MAWLCLTGPTSNSIFDKWVLQISQCKKRGTSLSATLLTLFGKPPILWFLQNSECGFVYLELLATSLDEKEGERPAIFTANSSVHFETSSQSTPYMTTLVFLVCGS